MVTDNTAARTQTVSDTLPRPVGVDAEIEVPRLARPHRLNRVGAAAPRLALVAVLAVALLVGALALGPRGDAAAAVNCDTVYALADFYENMGLTQMANALRYEAAMGVGCS